MALTFGYYWPRKPKSNNSPINFTVKGYYTPCGCEERSLKGGFEASPFVRVEGTFKSRHQTVICKLMPKG